MSYWAFFFIVNRTATQGENGAEYDKSKNDMQHEGFRNVRASHSLEFSAYIIQILALSAIVCSLVAA